MMGGMEMIRGRAWRLGDNISTDHIISGKYKFAYISEIEKMLPHLFEEVIPGFVEKVKPGDVIVAGRNFGIGSSREQAPRLIKMAGVNAVIAYNFSRIFYRNAINIGLLPIEARKIPTVTETGDIISIDLNRWQISNETKGVVEKVQSLPDFIIKIIESGGVARLLKSGALTDLI